ncbi:hypothetical protein ACTOVL_07680 [Arcanobacterium canis]
MTTPFTLSAATVTGVQNNNHYPNQHTVTDAASLRAVAGFDHVAAAYEVVWVFFLGVCLVFHYR